MFLFKCCQQFQTGVGYQLEKKNSRQKSFVNNLKEIDPTELHHEENRIIKLKKSEYEELYSIHSKSGKPFVDDRFPADPSSLGEIEGIRECQWKRITDIVKSPVLIAPKIQPNRVVRGSLGDCYFLSALAALAEQEGAIRTLFGNQEYTPSGIYRILAKIHGQIEEIIVDDYIPVNQRGEPLFCQANNSQFWVLILEKAWAKIHGSYANIIMGNPTEVFTTFTFAPAAMLLVKDNQEDREKLWNLLSDYSKQRFPVCCNTSEQIDTVTNLSPAHSYTLLDTAILEDMQGEHHKLMKLRDPWNKGIWTGAGSLNDRNFWAKIVSSTSKQQFCQELNVPDSGIFSMTFKDFSKYFSQVHHCLHQKNGNYISEPLLCNKKNGSLFEVEIHKRGLYSFELNQSELQLGQQDRKEEGACRATLLLIRKNINSGFDFVNGLLKYNDEDAVLTELLDPGNYLLFAKIDPTSHNCIPKSTVVSIYSTCFTVLQPTEQSKYPSLFKEVFLSHARCNKRNKYNNGLMWISWKLLFQQGGYAYIAMGVDAKSNKKFIIDFQEEEFEKMNFKLKGEYKSKGSQRIEIAPGEEKIILARVKNETIKSLKFPPQLGIKMELLE